MKTEELSDRELLELAAKVAGIGPVCWNEPVYAYEGGPLLKRGGLWNYVTDAPLWNPLDDDGDALRLAVKLSLLNEHPDFTYKLAEEQGPTQEARAPDSATRRAIVRAAAEIGKREQAA